MNYVIVSQNETESIKRACEGSGKQIQDQKLRRKRHYCALKLAGFQTCTTFLPLTLLFKGMIYFLCTHKCQMHLLFIKI